MTRCKAVTIFIVVLVSIMTGQAFARELTPMSDQALDEIYAEGISFQLDLSLTIDEAASVVLQGGNLADLQNLLTDGLSISAPSSATPSASVGSSLEPMANFNPQAMVDSIYIGGNAFQNASSLLNIIVQGGDVAVGVNITLVNNPVNSTFTVNQFNFNFSNITTSIGVGQ